MRDFKSVVRGIKAIKKPYVKPLPSWGVRFMPKKWWAIWWTPRWHRGRGAYISIGLWFIAIYRGYQRGGRNE